MLTTKVKICCISSRAEAKLAIDCGATAIGLVGSMPSGPGVISNDLIKDIAASISNSVSSFLLTSKVSANEIISHHKRVNTTTVQIVDKLREGSYADLRTKLTGVDIIQVIHVQDERSIEEAIAVSKYVDYILLDSGNPNLAVKELGGTGKVHNWEISKAIRERVEVPIYLAGGLNSTNVKEAIEFVRPYGVDLCSGVRTSGKLDRVKLVAFFRAIKEL